jgi:hypothetical protein
MKEVEARGLRVQAWDCAGPTYLKEKNKKKRRNERRRKDRKRERGMNVRRE